MRIVCPKCKSSYQISDAAANKSVRCGNTGCQFVFLATEAHDPAVPPPHIALSGAAPPPLPKMPSESNGSPVQLNHSIHGIHEPEQVPADAHSQQEQAEATLDSHHAPKKRSFGVTWIAFFWSILGFGGLCLGISIVSTAVLGGTAISGLQTELQRETHQNTAGGALLGIMFAELFGVLVFQWGLLSLVSVYGLWSFRKWGVLLAKILAAFNAVASLVIVVMTIIMRAGIITSLTGLILSVAVVAYFYGNWDSSGRLQQYYARLRESKHSQWEGYE